MKKIIAIFLTLVMAASLATVSLADSFYESPSKKPAPGVVEFEPKDEDCTANLVVTPFGDRDNLPENHKEQFEQAYDQIKNTEDLTTLIVDLGKLAADKGLDKDQLAVSDLFTTHVTDCDVHDDHFDFDITLDVDMLSHFVALVQLNGNGEWEIVNDARVTNNGEHLAFSVEELGTFAVVVSKDKPTIPDADTGTTGDVNGAPQTGESDARMRIYVAVMAVSAIVLCAVVVKSRRENA